MNRQIRGIIAVALVFTMNYADIVVVGGVLLFPSEVFAADYVCGQDLDTDGNIDKSGETSNCVATAQGQLCPIGAVNCIATYAAPICPSGGVLNTTTDKCEAQPLCAVSGWEYNTTLTACTQDVICPSGAVYNAVLNFCEYPPACPSGGTYNAANNRCDVNATYNPQYQCPYNGAVYGDAATCGANCYQPLSCSVSLSGSLASGGGGHPIYISPAGSYIKTAPWNCGGSPIASVNLSGFSITGDCFYIGEETSTGHLKYEAISNSSIGIFSWGECTLLDGNGTCIEYGWIQRATATWTVSGATVSGTAFSITYPYLYGTGNQLCGSWGGCLTFTPTSSSCNSYYACNDISFYSCPSSYTLAGSICIANPTCASGGNLNGDTDKCELTPPCPAGSSYSPSSDKCEASTESAFQCSAGFEYSPISKKCEAIPICSDGTYNNDTNGCYVGDNTCPIAPIGQYTCMTNSSGVNQCSSNQCVDLEGTPPIETQIDSKMLQDDGPTDPNTGECLGQISIFDGKGSRCRPKGKTVGYANNCCEGSDQVISEDMGNAASTILSNISTMKEVGEVAYYSYQVSTGAMQLGTVGTPGYLGYAELQPVYGSLGQAIGFAPAGSPAGATALVETATTGVAAGDATVVTGAVASGVEGAGAAAAAGATTTGAVTAGLTEYLVALFTPATIAVAVVVPLIMKIYFGGGCDENDLNTVLLRDSKLCHYIGDYCEKKWPIFGCVQKAQGYCCYNSKLGRIINEQGRPQLQSFGANGGWGTPQNPNCRGFTPEEFQMLDFAKIDLSEYFGEIQTKMQEQIQNNMSDKVQQFYQNTR